MRQHKLALCADHYVEWFQGQTERFIKKYHMFTRDMRILVAVEPADFRKGIDGLARLCRQQLSERG